MIEQPKNLTGWDRVTEDLRRSKEKDGLVEDINDNNFSAFLQRPRTVLVIGMSSCQFCKEYEPVVSRLARALPEVSFGWTVVDRKDGIEQIEIIDFFEELLNRGYPVTVIYKEGEDSFKYLHGTRSFEEASGFLTEYFLGNGLRRRLRTWAGNLKGRMSSQHTEK